MGVMKKPAASGRPPAGDGVGGSGGIPGGDEGGGRRRRGKNHAAETRGRPSRDGETEQGTRGTPRGDGGAGSGGVLASSGAGASGLQGSRKGGEGIGIGLGVTKKDRPPFSGFLVLCIHCTDEGMDDYKQKIEALGGEAITGFQYSTATHIAVEGDIPAGGRVIWEGDGKKVTTTRWIDSCFKAGKLLSDPLKDLSESLLPIVNVTPLASNKSTGRSCSSDGKLSTHRHGSRKRCSSRRQTKLSPTGIYHHLLICVENQRQSESLYDYALGLRTYQNITLPGGTKTSKLCKISMKFILDRCFSIMVSFHAQKKALGGLLSAKSFRVYSDDSVLLDIPESELVPYSDSEGDKDYTGFVLMVRKEVFHHQHLPIDIVEWLRLISKGVSGCHQILLSNFIYLMEPYQGFGAFVTMYLQFSSIQSTEGWDDLSWALSSYDNWKLPLNSLMLKTFYYIDKNGNKVEYEPDIRGLLRLLWNCSKHQAKREVKSFVHIVLSEYPSLLSDLQRSLYQLGYLSHLRLKN